MTEQDNERISQIHGALFGVAGSSKGLVGQVNDMAEVVGKLPCDNSSRRLKSLETWSATHDKEITDNSKFRKQQGLKLWHGIVLVIVTVLLSNLVSAVVVVATK